MKNERVLLGYIRYRANECKEPGRCDAPGCVFRGKVSAERSGTHYFEVPVDGGQRDGQNRHVGQARSEESLKLAQFRAEEPFPCHGGAYPDWQH